MKNTGFNMFRDALVRVLESNYQNFLLERQNYYIIGRPKLSRANITDYLVHAGHILGEEIRINKLLEEKRCDALQFISSDIETYVKNELSFKSTKEDLQTCGRTIVLDVINRIKKMSSDYLQQLMIFMDFCQNCELFNKLSVVLQEKRGEIQAFIVTIHIKTLSNRKFIKSPDGIIAVLKYISDYKNFITNEMMIEEVKIKVSNFINRYDVTKIADASGFGEIIDLVNYINENAIIKNSSSIRKLLLRVYRHKLSLIGAGTKLMFVTNDELIYLYKSRMLFDEALRKNFKIMPFHAAIENKISYCEFDEIDWDLLIDNPEKDVGLAIERLIITEYI